MTKRKMRMVDRLPDDIKRRHVCGIYLVLCLASLTPDGRFKPYVGAAMSIRKRFFGHGVTEGKTTAFARAIAKYGPENFVIELLEECEWSELDALEKKHIELQRSLTTQGTFHSVCLSLSLSFLLCLNLISFSLLFSLLHLCV